MGRTSSFAFKGKSEDLSTIAEKLHVATVLEGSVRKVGTGVRITAQLINAGDGYHLWSQAYDRDLTDVLAVQDEIARTVVAALKVKLLPGKEPGSRPRREWKPEAYDHYLIARRMLEAGMGTRAWSQSATEAIERSLALDPGQAPAWAVLAQIVFWKTTIFARARAEIAETIWR